MIKDAAISDCGLYRYELYRSWDDGPMCTFVMLNPSTADASEDDPTIRRCIGYAKREGCGALLVVNLFAFRATDPKIMKAADDPIGPENGRYLSIAFADTDGPIIAGWGAHGSFMERGEAVKALAPKMYCLGKTKAGEPRHPLYLKTDAPLMEYAQ